MSNTSVSVVLFKTQMYILMTVLKTTTTNKNNTVNTHVDVLCSVWDVYVC